MGPEQGHQQVLGDHGVQFDAPFLKIGKTDAALQDDQTTDVTAGQGFRGFTDLFRGDRLRHPGRGQGFSPHAAQHPADVGLKQDDDDEQEVADHAVQEPFQGE